MQDSNQVFAVGVDIGTSRIRSVIAVPKGDSGLEVVGFGESQTHGMRKGVISSPQDVIDAIQKSVEDAARISGFMPRSCTINVNGAHVTGVDSHGVVAISNAGRTISSEDRERAEEAAAVVSLPQNSEMVQVFAKNYAIDGHGGVKDPVGMNGVRLEVDTHIISASTPVVKGLHDVVSAAGLSIANITVAGLACAEVVLSRNQKEAGAAVVDIGASTTNIAVLEEGEVHFVGVVPVGGMHITNDLAIGLKTDLETAELVKRKYAKLGQADSGVVRVTSESGAIQFDKEDIGMIVDARVEELLELIEKQLKRAGRARKLAGGIVFCGGTSQLPGLAEFAKEHLHLACSVGSLGDYANKALGFDDDAYVTALGLAKLDLLLAPQGSPTNGAPRTSGNIKKLVGLLKRADK